MKKALGTICVAGLFVLLLSSASYAISYEAQFYYNTQEWAKLIVEEIPSGDVDVTTLKYTLSNTGVVENAIHMLAMPYFPIETTFAFIGGTIPDIVDEGSMLTLIWLPKTDDQGNEIGGIRHGDSASWTTSGQLNIDNGNVLLYNGGPADNTPPIAALLVPRDDQHDIQSAPEPGTLLLLGVGLMGMGVLSHVRRGRRS